MYFYYTVSIFLCKLAFITLSNAQEIYPGLTLEQAIIKIETLLSSTPHNKCGKVQIVGTQEFHKEMGGLHFHILIIIDAGLRDNTYRKILRALFHQFAGRTFDCQKVKRINNTINYIFKTQKTPNIVKAINGDYRSGFIYSNTDLFKLISASKIKLEPYLDNAIVVSRMIKYKTYDEFLISEGKLGLTSCSFSLKYRYLWDISRKLEIPEKILDKIYDIPSSEAEFNFLCKKYNITRPHKIALILILYFLCLKEGFKGIVSKPKYRNLYLAGPPNTGKTSLLILLAKVFGKALFYNVGNRSGDFTGFCASISPIIVYDDILSYPDLNWELSILLKLWGHEETLVDVKYGKPILVPPSRAIILSNIENLFYEPEHMNLRSRVHRIILKKSDICQWSEISDSELYIILRFILKDLIISLKDKDFSNNINYGSPAVRVRVLDPLPSAYQFGW